MTVLPDPASAPREPDPIPPAPAPPRPPWLLLWLIVPAGLAIGWWGAHQAAALLYARWKPSLEQQVGEVTGHPLTLGPFRGVGLDGLRVGPSSLAPLPGDPSSISVRELVLHLDPLASWQRRGPVLALDLNGARLDLVRNRQGTWWRLPPAKPGQPPRLELSLRLGDPARVNLRTAAGRKPVEQLSLTGSGEILPHKRRLALQLRLGRRGGAGQAVIAAGGRWDRQRWWGQLQTDRWPLPALLPLVAASQAPAGQPAASPPLLQGELSGRVALSLDRGQVRCQGDGAVADLRWRPAAGATPLRMQRLPLRCDGQAIAVADGPWQLGGWQGRVQGRIGFDRRLQLQARASLPAGSPAALRRAGQLQARLAARLRAGGLSIDQLQLSLGRSRLQLSGTAGGALQLAGPWRLDGPALAGGRWPQWLHSSPLEGQLSLNGQPADPRLTLLTGQDHQALIGPWQARLHWRSGVLALERWSAEHLQATGTLPLSIQRGRLRTGPLTMTVQVAAFPLPRLNPLLGSRLQGQLDLNGTIAGPIASLRPDLRLRLRDPSVGPMQLRETWQGRLTQRSLQLAAEPGTVPGQLQAQLNDAWLPVAVQLDRGDGSLRLTGSPKRFQWQARSLPLQGLQLAIGPRSAPRGLQGRMSGSGVLELQPLGFQGQVRVDQPELFGIGAAGLTASVRYDHNTYKVVGSLRPFDGGSIDARLMGRWRGPLDGVIQARGLSANPIRQIRSGWRLYRGEPAPRRGRASDLGELALDTVGDSLEAQLKALDRARERLQNQEQQARTRRRVDLAEQLQVRLDADLRLRGPDLRQLRANLIARAHLWLSRADRDQALAQAPLDLQLEGPLGSGAGTFSLAGLSFAMLNLITPVPESLRGSLAASGNYRLGGKRPELDVALELVDGHLGQQALRLDRGQVSLQGDALQVALGLRAVGAANGIDLAGRVPLDPQQDGLELRLSSRGDGLWFLANLTPQAFRWTEGRTDLQLLVRGSLTEPIANGFLRLREGRCQLGNQTLHDVDGTLLFDFEQLLVQDLRARVGKDGKDGKDGKLGQLQAQGRIGLVRPLGEAPDLRLRLDAVPLAIGRLKATGAGLVTLGGSLSAPEVGGQFTIAHGSFDASPADLAPLGSGAAAGAKGGRNLNSLLEAKWDFREPLMLLGPTVQSGVAESLNDAVPRLPWVRFQRLRLRFGPDLRVAVGTIANFRTAGLITVNGPLDPSLQLSGVMRLLGGRLNLFTTSFSLDPDTPNVAVFTPSLGLIPYLDIALRTRVADSLDVLLPDSNAIGAASVTGTNPNAGFASFSQMKLVQVTVSVTGPADRIAENLRLRSSPPLPQERLVALLGGNSLAGLSGGAAGTALATAVGQTLLSPLLSSLSDVFGQRVSLAVYPTYVNQAVSTQPGVRPTRVPPQLVLGTEIGFDITNRLKASVLAAPNRSDIPSQLTLNYKASDTLSLETYVDTQGALGGQLQVFFRF